MLDLTQITDLAQQNIETIAAAVGSGGLALALIFIVLRKKKSPSAEVTADAGSEKKPEILSPPPLDAAPKKNSWWDALSKTRAKFFFSSSTEIKDLKEGLEEACLVSDLGVQNTQEAFDKVPWSELGALPAAERADAAKEKLSDVFMDWLAVPAASDSAAWPAKRDGEPTIIWFVGVNGVGKTTSIAKLAQELKNRGHSVLLAAGDTFRAGAAEQLEIWADRLQIPCVKGLPGGDSSAVLFDAITSAKAKSVDYVLCDSAGRLHNQGQLMEALEKNRRVMAKALPSAPHEVLLVLDGNTGQNMLKQAEEFQKSVGVTGLILTKLDGTARGGAVVAVARKTGLPIRRLGLGESTEDFMPFEAKVFAQALLGLK